MKSAQAVRANLGDRRTVCLLGDIHLGNATTLEKHIDEVFTEIGRRDAWILGMGDYIENSGKRSPGSSNYTQTLQPRQQMDEFMQYVDPYAESLLGLITGNHEERTMNQTGFDPTEWMARIYRVPYLRYGGFVNLTAGPRSFTIFAKHGSSGAHTTAGSRRALARYQAIAEADLYAMGHVHKLDHWWNYRRKFNRKRKMVERNRVDFVITGSLVGYEDGYAEMKDYEPVNLGVPFVTIPDEGEVQVELFGVGS